MQTQPASVTPILDCLAPMPTPLYERKSRRALYFSMTLAVFTLVTRSYGFAIFVVWIVFIWFIKVAIHEVGHVLAGWFAGMRFESVAIGSVWLAREEGKIKIRFKRHALGGQANMSIMRLRRVRRQLVILTLGGPIATLLATLAVATLVIPFGSRWGNSVSGMFDASIYIFMTFSLYYLCLGLIPATYGAFPNDGLILKYLLTSPAQSKRMISAHALHLQISQAVDPLNLNRRWFSLTSEP